MERVTVRERGESIYIGIKGGREGERKRERGREGRRGGAYGEVEGNVMTGEGGCR